MNWNDYYMEQAGGDDYNTYRGSLYSRGYGMVCLIDFGSG